MSVTRRLALASVLASGFVTLPALAQPKSIRILVGFAPGGSVDALARAAAEDLQKALGVTVIVENKTGAAGRLTVDQVKAATPDGSVLMLVPQGPITMFPYVFKKLNYDPVRDFVPITRVATGDFAFTVGPMVPAKDVPAMKEWLKSAGPKASYASPGAGTVPHFIGVAIAKALGTPMTHVPYKGSALGMSDVAGGNIAAAVSPLTEALELHKAGRVRVLATTGTTRTPFLSDVPTFKEHGIDVNVPLWFGLYAPAGTPAATVDALRKAMHESLAMPATKERFAKLGLSPAPTTSAEQLVLQKDEAAMWEPVIKSSGFTPED